MMVFIFWILFNTLTWSIEYHLIPAVYAYNFHHLLNSIFKAVEVCCFWKEALQACNFNNSSQKVNWKSLEGILMEGIWAQIVSWNFPLLPNVNGIGRDNDIGHDSMSSSWFIHFDVTPRAVTYSEYYAFIVKFFIDKCCSLCLHLPAK